ncbi:DUF4382 domain-containing protein [Kaistella polysaccharea]|uniref:DUF4382 domain-containing protein n=1 Tax=Kaistella polysaccharea TaxID=2878534 RepID=UPI001CF426C1|nr:DUF4382 domain-containing protein [Kaistella polysaccharea]
MKNIFLALSAMLLAFTSCQNDSSTDGNATLKVHLTDAPGQYEKVEVDIQKLELGKSDAAWTTLNLAKAGIYNLLDLNNGVDVLLGETVLPAGAVTQLRMILGSENYVTVDGVRHPLATPSAQQSGLKLNWMETLQPDGAYEIWLDFDADKSVVKQGNGSYLLKPVIRIFSKLTDGQIKGYVAPAEAQTTVKLLNATTNEVLMTAIPEANGYFMLRGIPEGSYKLMYDALESTKYIDVTKDVTVTYGKVLDLGTATLVK